MQIIKKRGGRTFILPKIGNVAFAIFLKISNYTYSKRYTKILEVFQFEEQNLQKWLLK